MGYVVPGRDSPRARPYGESSWETAAAVAAAVTWKLRLTFRPGNYIWRFSYGFGVVVRDIGEWRPGFYSEFRCRYREHSGLAQGAIFRKVLDLTAIPKSPCSFCPGTSSANGFFRKLCNLHTCIHVAFEVMQACADSCSSPLHQ